MAPTHTTRRTNICIYLKHAVSQKIAQARARKAAPTWPVRPRHGHLTRDRFPTQCPLCGADNRCAMEIERATGQAQPPCWCVQAHFPPELITSLPTEAVGASAFARGCLQRHAQAAPHNPQGAT
ncbi:MAG: cysteine-rich CWC family protein [Burkholderiaceae bacterium]